MKTMTAVEAKNSFGQLLEAAFRKPVAVTKNRREVAAVFSMEDVRALADSFLAAPLKAEVATGKLDLLDALMAQVDLNRRLEVGRKAIAEGDGIVADATYFTSLRDRARRRVS
jgi:prevent-host-death family protein